MAGSDKAGREHGRNLGFDFGFLVVRVTVGTDANWGRVGKKGNVMLNGSGWGKFGGF